MSAPVFIVDRAALTQANAGDVVRISGDEGHHASVVQRLEAGEPIELVDGQGIRARGHVTARGKGWLDCEVSEVEREKPEPISITLVQALAKSDRSELAIQTATELGVTRVIPWQAQHCVVQWRADRQAKSVMKWRQAVRAAAKQSRRSWVPIVEDLHTTAALVEIITQAIREGDQVYVLHESATQALVEQARYNIEVTPPRESGRSTMSHAVWLVVGPEGGISDEECAAFEAAGAHITLLGSHVLRTSTAGPAAIVALQVLWGAWGQTR